VLDGRGLGLKWYSYVSCSVKAHWNATCINVLCENEEEKRVPISATLINHCSLMSEAK